MIKYIIALCFALIFGLSAVHAQNFSTHQVKKGETIEGLAKHYHVTPSQIYEYNPDAKKGLKPNTILIVPLFKAKKPEVALTKTLESYKEHKVKRKETLYGLSKKYNVTEDDIKKYNKYLYAKNLRKGDIIKIPVFKTTETEINKEPSTKSYTVLSKEGKWRIAYKFGITLEELELLNPDMGETLQVGQQINVPNIEKDLEHTIDEHYDYYKVLPKEGFYRLKIKLGLEQQELEVLNPGLKETGLKEGMILKVPFTATHANQPNENIEKVALLNKTFDAKTKHLVVMLPFRLNRVDFEAIESTKKSVADDPYLNASLDFYSGVLYALDSLKKMGVSLKVDVYDTKYLVSEVSNIIDNNDFTTVDAVIGPLTSATFQKASEALRRYNTPVVSPIGTNVKLYDNVFQSRPSDELLKHEIVNYVKNSLLPENIVIISDTKNQATTNHLKNEFATAKTVYSRKDKAGKDAYFVNVNDINSVLQEGKNVIFLETQNDGFASNVTSILASLNQKGGKEIILATTNFNGAFESDEISNEHLSNLQFHFATVSKSYSETTNNTFVKTYETQYGISPSKRAVKGFDLTMDVVLRMVTAGSLYQSVLEAPLTEYVENKFAYKKEAFGGYSNTSVYLVKYDNLMLVEVK